MRKENKERNYQKRNKKDSPRFTKGNDKRSGKKKQPMSAKRTQRVKTTLYLVIMQRSKPYNKGEEINCFFKKIPAAKRSKN